MPSRVAVLIIFSSFAFCSLGIGAEPTTVIEIWPAGAPGEAGDIGPERQTFDGRPAYGMQSALP